MNYNKHKIIRFVCLFKCLKLKAEATKIKTYIFYIRSIHFKALELVLVIVVEVLLLVVFNFALA